MLKMILTTLLLSTIASSLVQANTTTDAGTLPTEVLPSTSLPAPQQSSLDAILATSDLTDDETVCGLVRGYPLDTPRIIQEAIRAEATADTIAMQCRCELQAQPSGEIFNMGPAEALNMPTVHIQTIVTTALAENLEPFEPVLETCLVAVNDGEAIDVIISALAVLDPTRMEDTLALMYAILDYEGVDATAVLVNSLVDGGFLLGEEASPDCQGDCLRPIAESIVQSLQPIAEPQPDLVGEPIIVQSDLDEGADPAPQPDPTDSEEPALSPS